MVLRRQAGVLRYSCLDVLEGCNAAQHVVALQHMQVGWLAVACGGGWWRLAGGMSGLVDGVCACVYMCVYLCACVCTRVCTCVCG